MTNLKNEQPKYINGQRNYIVCGNYTVCGKATIDEKKWPKNKKNESGLDGSKGRIVVVSAKITVK